MSTSENGRNIPTSECLSHLGGREEVCFPHALKSWRRSGIGGSWHEKKKRAITSFFFSFHLPEKWEQSDNHL